MQLNDILTLARAGFTAEQIAQLSAAAQPAKPAAAPDPQPQPAPAPAPDPQPQPQPQPQPAQDPLQLILAQLQHINRAGAQQPPDPQPLTGEQVLANIISPPWPGNK